MFSLAIGLFFVCALVVNPAATLANTIVIDSFDNPNPGTNFFVPGLAPWGSGNPFLNKDTVVGVLGGERDILVQVVGTPLPISAAGIIGYEPVYGNGVLEVGTYGRAGTRVTAQYDGVDMDSSGALVDAKGLGPVDLTDGGVNDRLQLAFNSVDGGNALALGLAVTAVGAGGTPTTVNLLVPESGTPFVYDIPFAAFPVNVFGSVESLTFEFNNSGTPTPNVDFELDSVVAVPEPSTLVSLSALGALLVVVGTWRWRKR
ncbi:MAG: PEP-CTERM sorting domain-containing protein [Pirellulales bacterium]|nr:PEP-CTERM sorting domain-containing protein [Pirellulales bacterium]